MANLYKYYQNHRPRSNFNYSKPIQHNLYRGVNETIRRIKEKYQWQGMKKDVRTFIKTLNLRDKLYEAQIKDK